MHPVALDALLRVDQRQLSAAHGGVQGFFDSIFVLRFRARLRPEIAHVVRAAEFERNEMIERIEPAPARKAAAIRRTAARDAVGVESRIAQRRRHLARISCIAGRAHHGGVGRHDRAGRLKTIRQLERACRF